MAIIDTGRNGNREDPTVENGGQNADPAPFDQTNQYAPFTPDMQTGSFKDTPAPSADYGFDKPAELELGEDDVRLPWLEGDDDDEFDERRSGVGQGLVLMVLGLVAIAAIIGGLMWAMRDRPDEQLVADGGLIEAPKEPYKTKPENPGGEVVAGTGDTSFAVAEGQTRPFKIDGKDEAPKPGFDSVDKPAPDAPAASPPAASSGGVGVQVGAYSSKDAAEAGWNALKSQYSALSGVSHRILQGQADIGTVYRLQAVPGDKTAARSLCNGMRAAGLSCQVKD